MAKYKNLNNLFGWLTFAVAAIVYLLTIEPTVSWWDCGEFIACSYKLETGHPPGNPVFLLVGRFFTMFAGGNVMLVAKMMNVMSAMASAFTVLFLFWTITHLARKIAEKSGELTGDKLAIIMGSGIVGALAYTFSDSFWFSAVEGEVYASSAFFTAIVFWAILKWEETENPRFATRWIILIAYLMGLSIGVHLLNLLTIPAIGLVYYAKYYKPTLKGSIIAFLISSVILVIVQYGIIPGVFTVAGKFELLFTNVFGMPFNTGLFFYIFLIVALVVFGLIYTQKKGHHIANMAILCFAFILIGYSSYATVLIRSSANTPLDENDPQDVFSMLSYINREQYGDRPLLYGQCFNAEVTKVEDAGDVYKPIGNKYVKVDTKKKYQFDEKNSMLFPRMYSSDPNHIQAYKSWSGCKEDRKPTFGQNLKFFFDYQCNWMYFRYFMWNFAGRQNDVQGHGNITEGNWLSGIGFIDSMRLGPQDNLPKSMTENKGRNVFYMLPLILGIVGMFFHYKKDGVNAWIVMLLFFITGLAIIIYLNQNPYQPRERDYAYAGSFYAFAIWIGLGVMGLWDMLKKYSPSMVTAVAVTGVSLVLVPGIMAKEGWDDHDRSQKYGAHDFASNYLESCPKNAILFTNGDNDTFPLWYLQEVEGVRTDVRVANYTLLGGDWHIHQMFLKSYDSDPLPLTMSPEQYNQGTNDYLRYFDMGVSEYTDLKQVIDFVKSSDPKTKLPLEDGTISSYLPTKKFFIPVDSLKVLKNGTVNKADAANIVKYIPWELKKNVMYKHEFMVYDLLATNNWERPICFASPQSVDDILPLGNFFKMQGYTSRLVPAIDTNNRNTDNIDTETMYNNMMTKFKWGNFTKAGVYVDPESLRMVMISRSLFARLANALIAEGKRDKAKKLLARCMEVFPNEAVPYDMYMLAVAESYYRLGDVKKGAEISDIIGERYIDELNYYLPLLSTKHMNDVVENAQQGMAIVKNIADIAQRYGQTTLQAKYSKMFEKNKQFFPMN